jgi:hypothetical protein
LQILNARVRFAATWNDPSANSFLLLSRRSFFRCDPAIDIDFRRTDANFGAVFFRFQLFKKVCTPATSESRLLTPEERGMKRGMRKKRREVDESVQNQRKPRPRHGSAIRRASGHDAAYALTTLPDLMHPVQTRMRLFVAFTLAFTVCRLMFQRRRETLCAWEMLLPNCGFLPQISHTCAIDPYPVMQN